MGKNRYKHNLDHLLAEQRDRHIRTSYEGRIQLYTKDGRICIVSPYDEQFVHGARGLGGRWEKDAHIWSFPLNCRGAVINLIAERWNVKLDCDIQSSCQHKFYKVEGGIKCVLCSLFKERG